MALGFPQLGLLLVLAALAAILSRRLHLPYTVGLVLGGMVLSAVPGDSGLHFSRNLVYAVFLPPLVFEAALHIRARELWQNAGVVGTLATFGVLAAAVITAVGMHLAVGWPWTSALVFGVLIAATDPVSVIATLRESGVRGRLRLLLEAESLLNDGTAAAFFTLALGLALGAATGPLRIAGEFVLAVGGGILCGALVGWVAMYLAGRAGDALVEITVTTLAAYGSFHLAERCGGSGVIAALTAGLVLGNAGPHGGFSPASRAAVESFWEYLAFVTNSLVFLLMGASMAQQHFAAFVWPALAAILLVTFGRAIAIYPLCALFERTRSRVELRFQHLLVWGGLRGALALALALSIPDALPQRDAIVTCAFAVVAFSVFAQGLTLKPVLRRLGLL